jgi:hypothetical protein
MQERELEALLAALRQVQDEEYLSIRGMARRLGFSASYLSMLYARKRRPGLRFVRAVLRRYPRVREIIAARRDPDTRRT